MSGTITINSTDLANAIKPQLLQMPEITQHQYSYIIWTDGTNYYAKNGKTGQIDYSGTDAAKVIQSAIQNMTSGIIFVKSGTYSISDTIRLKSNIALLGERMQATTFVSSVSPMFKLDSVYYAEIGNIDLEPAGNWAIQINGGGLNYIHDVRIYGGADGILLDQTYWNVIERCIFSNQSDSGILIGATNPANANWILESRFYSCRKGITLNAGSMITIEKCDISGNGTQYGIECNGLAIINECWFENLARGVSFYSGAVGSHFGKNYFAGVSTPIVNNIPGKVYFENSWNYITKNSGKATFSGDGTTTQFKISHGLASTPSKVLVTPGSSDAKGTFYVTADATYIYVNYTTAPPAGTNNIDLYWYAEV